MNKPFQDRFRSLWQTVGQTPMYRIRYRYRKGPDQEMLVKYELGNPTGSIKDRMALHILQRAYERGRIHPGDTIVEATSGSTGIAFAALGRALDHPVRIIMPDWLSTERRQLISGYGADIQLVSREQGGFRGSLQLVHAVRHHDGIFLPRQFDNPFNSEVHELTTGPEIDRQLVHEGLRPAAFVAGIGTGGTIMGIGKFLRTVYPNIRIHPLEPAESPILTTGHKTGTHRIQGISDEFIPSIVNLAALDEVIPVNDGDAILMAQALGKSLGLGVGISSGANLVGAIKAQQGLGTGQTVLTVFSDCNKKYLSTDLFKEEPVKAHYITPDIRLLGYEILNRHLNAS